MERLFSILMFVIVCSAIFIYCKKTFTPKLDQSDINLLIVDGYIDGSDTVFFKMSRSRKIYPGDSATSKNELRARISIEDDHHNTYPLIESGNGLYRSNTILNLNPAYQYRIHFFTSDNKEYASDFVSYKVSRPIDSIGWDLKNDGIQLYVNTHDPANSTRYYRWEYNETWEFKSQYQSDIRYDTIIKDIVNRTEQVHICWKSVNSTAILLGTTATLSNDVVSKAPLILFPYHDERLDILYSPIVKQYPLDLPAYNFWQALKQSTESTGSIFDPQPTEISGNIHGVADPSQRVVGYVSAGTTYKKRTFINSNSMPSDWARVPFCGDTFWVVPPKDYHKYFGPPSPADEPVTPIYNGISILGYVAASKLCVDCTLTGTNKKPSFWP